MGMGLWCVCVVGSTFKDPLASRHTVKGVKSLKDPPTKEMPIFCSRLPAVRLIFTGILKTPQATVTAGGATGNLTVQTSSTVEFQCYEKGGHVSLKVLALKL